MFVPVIMAGGSGTRLWPMSRSLYPKQFLPLLGGESTMLQDTCTRLNGLPLASPLVICGEEHRFIAAEQTREVWPDEHAKVILEPEGRNTAPAVALAALHAVRNGEDPLLLVLAADHAIKDAAHFIGAVKQAAEHAAEGKLVTFGIVPTAPETGYGYIRCGSAVEPAAKIVEEFVEKPDRETAEQYVDSGNFVWNSGMFLFKASSYLQELQQHRPDIHQTCVAAIDQATVDHDFIRPDRDAFLSCPDDSIDYAVMEKTQNAVVVPLSCGWSDVGSWSSLWENTDRDEDSNVALGDVITQATSNCYIRSDQKLIATVGVENLVVVESDDAIMVADMDKVQDVKAVVQSLKQANRSEAKLHRKVYRPWGYYDSIDSGERFQVKRIVVNPGEKLSLQMHHHRAEHWIVVSGTAKVTNGDDVILLAENESTYIPLGHTHRLENPGVIPLELIEVQSGSYLGEDDIVRFEDTYGREQEK